MKAVKVKVSELVAGDTFSLGSNPSLTTVRGSMYYIRETDEKFVFTRLEQIGEDLYNLHAQKVCKEDDTCVELPFISGDTEVVCFNK